jgi:hypothetical protein
MTQTGRRYAFVSLFSGFGNRTGASLVYCEKRRVEAQTAGFTPAIKTLLSLSWAIKVLLHD